LHLPFLPNNFDSPDKDQGIYAQGWFRRQSGAAGTISQSQGEKD